MNAASADLAARFGVERSLVGNEGGFVASGGRSDLAAAANDGLEARLRDLRLITEKFARADTFAHVKPHRFGRRIARANPGGAGVRPLNLMKGSGTAGLWTSSIRESLTTWALVRINPASTRKPVPVLGCGGFMRHGAFQSGLCW